MTEREALKLMIEAFEAIPEEIEGWIPDKCTDAVIAAKEALAQPKQGYTTKRNAWTGKAIHKCNVCGRDDFRSEHAAKFHKCEAVEEPRPHSQDRWLDIQLPDTTPPQRKPLTDEHPLMVFAKECVLGAYKETELADAAQRAIDAAQGIKGDA